MSVIYTIFFISVGIQFLFLTASIIKLSAYSTKKRKIQDSAPPVSILVCAHNQGKNLEMLLPKLFSQRHHLFEIIVINDRSQDETSLLLKKQSEKDQRLKVITVDTVPEGLNGKKYGISLGVKAAVYEILLFTDADCLPASNYWIQEMARSFEKSTQIVLGYSQYKKQKGFLNLFIRYETLYTAIYYVTMALSGNPYMGVGRNLAYRKAFFLNNNGFKGLWNIVGGDDDLFINRYATAYNTKVCIGHDALVKSIPKESFKGFYHQKIRHLSVGKLYKGKDKFILGWLLISHILFWLSFLSLIIAGESSYAIMVSFSLRIGVLYALFLIAIKRLGDNFNILPLAILDFLFIFYYIIIGLMAFFVKKIKWI